MKCLFLGGYFDGCWVDSESLPGAPWYKMIFSSHQYPNTNTPDSFVNKELTVSYQTYNRLEFSSNKKSFFIYIYNELDDNPMEKLINGYMGTHKKKGFEEFLLPRLRHDWVLECLEKAYQYSYLNHKKI